MPYGLPASPRSIAAKVLQRRARSRHHAQGATADAAARDRRVRSEGRQDRLRAVLLL